MSVTSTPLRQSPSFEILTQRWPSSSPESLDSAKTSSQDLKEQVSQLKACLEDPDWDCFSDFNEEIWREFIFSLPADGSRDREFFNRIPITLWSCLLPKIGSNRIDFDLSSRLSKFTGIFQAFSEVEPYLLLVMVRSHNLLPIDVEFWGLVFGTFTEKTWKKIVIELTTRELQEFFFTSSGHTNIRELDPETFDQFEEAISTLKGETEGLFTQYGQLVKLPSFLSILARLFNHYIEKFKILNDRTSSAMNCVFESYPLVVALRSLSNLANNKAWDIQITDEHRKKIEELFKQISPSKHLDLRHLFENNPVKSFMSSCIQPSDIAKSLKNFLEQDDVGELKIRREAEEDPEIATFANHLFASPDEPPLKRRKA